MLIVTPGCSGQGQFPAQSYLAGPQRMFQGRAAASKKMLKYTDEPKKSFRINKSVKKTNPNELKTKRKNVLKIRKKAKTNWKTDLTGEEQENGNNQPSGDSGKCRESKEFLRPYESGA